MAPKSPLQVVKERFESKLKLAESLLGKLERSNPDESDEDFARRVRTMSNVKLLRLVDTHDIVDREFGGKAGLVDAIMTLRTPTGKPDLDYRKKLETFRITRLLDMQRSAAKAARDTARKVSRAAAKSAAKAAAKAPKA
jgi:hypothetical protein